MVNHMPQAISHNAVKTQPYKKLSVVTLVLLCIPALAMMLTDEVQWQVGDFVVMASLIFVSGSIAIKATELLGKNYKWLISSFTFTLFLIIWAELAVGIFP